MYTETHVLLSAAVAGWVWKEDIKVPLACGLAATIPDWAMIVQVAVKWMTHESIRPWWHFTGQYNLVTHSFLFIGSMALVVLICLPRSNWRKAAIWGWFGHAVLDMLSHGPSDRGLGYLWPLSYKLGVYGLFDYRVPGTLAPLWWNFLLDALLLALVAWQNRRHLKVLARRLGPYVNRLRKSTAV